MHCEKCAGRVTEAVNDIPGLAGVVNLKKGIVTVSYEREVPDGQIRAAIERVGYAVKEIQKKLPVTRQLFRIASYVI